MKTFLYALALCFSFVAFVQNNIATYIKSSDASAGCPAYMAPYRVDSVVVGDDKDISLEMSETRDGKNTFKELVK